MLETTFLGQVVAVVDQKDEILALEDRIRVEGRAIEQHRFIRKATVHRNSILHLSKPAISQLTTNRTIVTTLPMNLKEEMHI